MSVEDRQVQKCQSRWTPVTFSASTGLASSFIQYLHPSHVVYWSYIFKSEWTDKGGKLFLETPGMAEKKWRKSEKMAESHRSSFPVSSTAMPQSGFLIDFNYNLFLTINRYGHSFILLQQLHFNQWHQTLFLLMTCNTKNLNWVRFNNW